MDNNQDVQVYIQTITFQRNAALDEIAKQNVLINQLKAKLTDYENQKAPTLENDS